MSYRHHHNIPYNSKIEEAIVASFSWGQLLWLAPAVFLSFQMTKLPLLPFDSFLFSRLHWALPIVIAIVFIKVKHPKTNLTLSKYLILMLKLRKRRRKFLYKRESITEFERSQRKGEEL